MTKHIHEHSLLYIPACHVAAWGILILADILEERRILFTAAAMWAALLLPLLCAVMSVVLVVRGVNRDWGWKDRLLRIGFWLVIGAVPSAFIWNAVNYHQWVIPQQRGMLDGIEYMFFGILWTAGCAVVFLVADLIEWKLRGAGKKDTAEQIG